MEGIRWSVPLFLFYLVSCVSLAQSVKIRCEEGFKSDGVECVQVVAAHSDCAEGMKWTCSDAEGSEESCFCESLTSTARVRECPASTSKVVLQEAVEEDGLPEVFKCEVSVENASDVICNHGWVLDYHKDMCLAARGFEATCTCPEHYRANLSRGMCVKQESAEEQSVSRLLRSGRFLQTVIPSSAVTMTCRCPEGSLTARAYHMRTADSSVGQEVKVEETTHPGHNGCFAVEYRERLHTCTKGGAGETVDSDLNPTHQNACENRLLIDPVSSCPDGAEERCTFKEGEGVGRVRNEKNCQCVTRERVRGTLSCDDGATLVGNSCITKQAGTPYCDVGELVKTAEGPICATSS